MTGAMRRLWRAAAPSILALALAAPAYAAPTPGYSERVLQWKVQEGETCADIATSLYGSASHAPLLLRYNDVSCGVGKKLEVGRVLVVPEKVTTLPPASLYSTTPTVKARAPGADWTNAASGMPLFRLYSVNTLAQARADVRFVDRTRIVLSEHTLVVIYETASASSVAKKPPAVELQEGEVQAALAGLAGRPVGVGVTGGGRVDASSRDAVLRRKGERTTVSVFDGSARVESGGQKVEVPLNFGSSFVRAKPPTPPRPLPPAPLWAETSSAGIVLALPGAGRLGASWSEVPKAVKYRLEVARDSEFKDLILREETPADVRAFRAENFPPGSYYLRVRAVDGEDFLGIASAQRQAILVEAKVDGGAVEASTIRANPYGFLALSPAPELELAVDGGAFGPMVPALDLLRQHPATLRFRVRGLPQERAFPIQYLPVGARIRTGVADRSGARLVHVELSGVAGVDVPSRVGPRLLVHRSKKDFELALTPSAEGGFAATLAPLAGASASLRVVDARGRTLGDAIVEDVSPPAPAHAPIRRIGVTSPPSLISPRLNVPWTSPSFSSSFAVGFGGEAERGDAQGQGFAKATGEVGAWGLEATVATNGLRTRSQLSADSRAWLGAGYRFGPPSTRDWQLLSGLALRFGLPTVSGGVTRVEPSILLGTSVGRWTWLSNLGGRALLSSSELEQSLQGFATLGGTYALTPDLRVYSLLDGHLLQLGSSQLSGRCGLAAGLEVGSRVFATLGARATPWNEPDGLFAGQVAVGVRGW